MGKKKQVTRSVPIYHDCLNCGKKSYKRTARGKTSCCKIDFDSRVVEVSTMEGFKLPMQVRSALDLRLNDTILILERERGKVRHGVVAGITYSKLGEWYKVEGVFNPLDADGPRPRLPQYFMMGNGVDPSVVLLERTSLRCFACEKEGYSLERTERGEIRTRCCKAGGENDDMTQQSFYDCDACGAGEYSYYKDEIGNLRTTCCGMH